MGYGVLLGLVGLGWEFEGVVGAGDDVEGGVGVGCRTGGVVRHGPPKTSARPIRRAQGRLTTNGLRGEVFDYGLEFFEVGEFGSRLPWMKSMGTG